MGQYPVSIRDHDHCLRPYPEFHDPSLDHGLFRQIIPHTLSVIVTYAPFAVSGGIVALTSLDYLGFELPAPTPSRGELLSQGWQNREA